MADLQIWMAATINNQQFSCTKVFDTVPRMRDAWTISTFRIFQTINQIASFELEMESSREELSNALFNVPIRAMEKELGRFIF